MSDSKRQPQPFIEKKEDAEMIHQFLQHVVRGEQDEVEKMLKVDPTLAYKKGKITDYSGRQFLGIGDKNASVDFNMYYGRSILTCGTQWIQKEMLRVKLKSSC